METTNVAIVNGISLQVVADEREQLVAVKPVCEILGVNYTTQVDKLKAHPVFGSVIPLRGTTGADGKTYQMLCIPRYSVSFLCRSQAPKNGFIMLVTTKETCDRANIQCR